MVDLKTYNKGRTIRKVMGGGGGGEFSRRRNFLLLSTGGELTYMNFFSFNIPLREIFFVLRLPTPPNKFSNGPSVSRHVYEETLFNFLSVTLTKPTVIYHSLSGLNLPFKQVS